MNLKVYYSPEISFNYNQVEFLQSPIIVFRGKMEVREREVIQVSLIRMPTAFSSTSIMLFIRYHALNTLMYNTVL